MDPSGPVYEERIQGRDLIVRDVALWLAALLIAALFISSVLGRPMWMFLFASSWIMVFVLPVRLSPFLRTTYRLYRDRLVLDLAVGIVGMGPDAIPLEAILAFHPWSRKTAREVWRTHRVDHPEYGPVPPWPEGPGWWVVVLRGKAMRRAVIFRPSPELVGRIQGAMRDAESLEAPEVAPAAAPGPGAGGPAARPPRPVASVVP